MTMISLDVLELFPLLSVTLREIVKLPLVV